MGWRGVMRSAVAAARAAEKRSHQRRKTALKAQIMQEGSEAIGAWEDYLERLSSIHHDGCEKIDWLKLLNSAPSPPAQGSERSDAARARLQNRKPSVFDFIRGGFSRVQSRLQAEVRSAEDKEASDLGRLIKAYEVERAEWEADARIAQKLIDGDPEETRNVLMELKDLSENGLLGKQVRFLISSATVHVVAEVHQADIVPTTRPKQLASGRISETKMPVSEFHERYQDYVASVAFRLATDVLNVLPRDEVHVTCTTQMLDPQTGHVDAVPILYVRFMRQTLSRLKLTSIDPSDALANFIHTMNFKRTKGFGAIKPVLPISQA